MHPLGLEYGTDNHQTCGNCFWSSMAGPGPKVLRCVPSGQQRVDASWKGCSFWQKEIACLDCAACCGPAFDAVEVSQRDPVRKKHPRLIIRKDGRIVRSLHGKNGENITDPLKWQGLKVWYQEIQGWSPDPNAARCGSTPDLNQFEITASKHI